MKSLPVPTKKNSLVDEAGNEREMNMSKVNGNGATNGNGAAKSGSLLSELTEAKASRTEAQTLLDAADAAVKAVENKIAQKLWNAAVEKAKADTKEGETAQKPVSGTIVLDGETFYAVGKSKHSDTPSLRRVRKTAERAEISLD